MGILFSHISVYDRVKLRTKQNGPAFYCAYHKYSEYAVWRFERAFIVHILLRDDLNRALLQLIRFCFVLNLDFEMDSTYRTINIKLMIWILKIYIV